MTLRDFTRARDRLYIAGFEGNSGIAKGSWYETIEQGLEGHLTEADAAVFLKQEGGTGVIGGQMDLSGDYDGDGRVDLLLGDPHWGDDYQGAAYLMLAHQLAP